MMVMIPAGGKAVPGKAGLNGPTTRDSTLSFAQCGGGERPTTVNRAVQHLPRGTTNWPSIIIIIIILFFFFSLLFVLLPARPNNDVPADVAEQLGSKTLNLALPPSLLPSFLRVELLLNIQVSMSRTT